MRTVMAAIYICMGNLLFTEFYTHTRGGGGFSRGVFFVSHHALCGGVRTYNTRVYDFCSAATRKFFTKKKSIIENNVKNRVRDDDEYLSRAARMCFICVCVVVKNALREFHSSSSSCAE